jgi:hypothetical protein
MLELYEITMDHVTPGTKIILMHSSDTRPRTIEGNVCTLNSLVILMHYFTSPAQP